MGLVGPAAAAAAVVQMLLALRRSAMAVDMYSMWLGLRVLVVVLSG
jgi:hypothetical protein